MFPMKWSGVFISAALGGILAVAAPVHIAAAGEGRKEPLLTVLERTTQPLVKADRP